MLASSSVWKVEAFVDSKAVAVTDCPVFPSLGTLMWVWDVPAQIGRQGPRPKSSDWFLFVPQVGPSPS